MHCEVYACVCGGGGGGEGEGKWMTQNTEIKAQDGGRRPGRFRHMQ